MRHHKRRYNTALPSVLKIAVPLDRCISSKNSVALLIGVQDGFRCKRPFIHPLQISIGAVPFISIPDASFGSSSKDLYPRCPMRACEVSILGAVTRLAVAGFGFSANQIISVLGERTRRVTQFHEFLLTH